MLVIILNFFIIARIFLGGIAGIFCIMTYISYISGEKFTAVCLIGVVIILIGIVLLFVLHPNAMNAADSDGAFWGAVGVIGLGVLELVACVVYDKYFRERKRINMDGEINEQDNEN